MSAVASVAARPVLDSRGEWTIEVTVETVDGAVATTAVPQGESRGSAEAAAVPAEVAVQNVVAVIGPALSGVADVLDQAGLDRQLVELDGTANKSRLGANATLAVSLAAARAAARERGLPLWRHLRALSGLAVADGHAPRLVALFVEGGLHAPGGLPFQEYLVLPRPSSAREAVGLVAALYRALRAELARRFGPAATRLGDEGAFAPPAGDLLEPFAILSEVAGALGVRGRYDVGLDAAATNVRLSDAERLAVYRRLRAEHPLVYLEDPCGEDDFSGFAALRREFGDDVMLTGDDLTVTNVGRMAEAARQGSVNAVVVKPNQIGTLTETLAAVRRARDLGWRVVVSHRGEETNDDFIADLAYGVGADGLKLGAPARGERVAKYNRFLAIAEGR